MKILVTNASSPTFAGTLHALSTAPFANTIIGVSSNDESYVKHLVDEYIAIDDSEDYLTQILDICKKCKPEILIPHSISDRILFMQNKTLFEAENVKILSSSAESIVTVESKLTFMDECRKIGIPTPEYYVATTYSELKLFAKNLGYPEKKVVVKPVSGSGSKGFRILNKKSNFRKLFDQCRADHPDITLSNLRNIIGDKFKPLIVSQFLDGEEYTLDCIKQGNLEKYIVRQRVETKNGLTSVGQIVHLPLLEKRAQVLAKHFGLTTIFGFQFMNNSDGEYYILECNPRIQGTTIMTILSGANIIAASVAELTNKEPVPIEPELPFTYYRTYGGIGIGKTTSYVNIQRKNT